MKKGIAAFFTFLTMALTLALCPSFLSSASADNSYVWSVSTSLKDLKAIGYPSAKYSASFDLDLSCSFDSKTKDIIPNLDSADKVIITYPAFTYVLRYRYPESKSYWVNIDISSVPDLKPYLSDGTNYYALDYENGGTIVIDNPTNITYLSIYLRGHFTGSVSFKDANNYSYAVKAVYISGWFNSFNMTFTSVPSQQTITDSEGMTWTVPEGMQNPVVVRNGTLSKYLIDGVSGLCYFAHPTEAGKYLFGSESPMSVAMYMGDTVATTASLTDAYSDALGIEPVCTTTTHSFTEFLYGSLPLMETTPKARTITDSEGTVWTVPDAVENPVVIKYNETQKYMLDAVAGLCYFNKPQASAQQISLLSASQETTKKILGSQEYINVLLYDLDLVSHKALLNQEYAAEIGIEPVYCTHMFHFTEFLYGSLPEMTVTPLAPEPEPSPSPSPEPSGDDLVNLGSVKIGTSETGDLVKEGTVYVSGGVLNYKTKHADFVSQSHSTETQYIRHAVIDDYCQHFIGRFTLDVDTDGYVSMMFPDLFLFPEMIKPEEYVPLNINSSSGIVAFPPDDSGLPALGLLSEWAEPIVVLYADGKKYVVSPYGGNVRIPVNVGENVVIMAIDLQVKDEFYANHDGDIQAVYQCMLEDFAVYIREYKDQSASDIEQIKGMLGTQLEESQKQTDALTNYGKADQMESDKSSLDGAIKDYGDAENSIFESAGEGIGKFDISTGFNFGGNLLAAIAFLSVIISNIILAMGDFSMLYTVGMCLVLVGILFGIYKFAVAATESSIKKDKRSRSRSNHGGNSGGKK